MDILLTAKEALKEYEEGEMAEANRLMSTLHLEIYEGTCVARDIQKGAAHDLYQFLENDFPMTSYHPNTMDGQRKATFCSTGKIIVALLSDYLMT